MKIKQIVCLLAAFLFLAFGCAAPTLREKKTVRLTVVTDAENYEVVSSCGEVSGRDGEYTVVLPAVQDLVITVSAEGYETENVRITREELLAGPVHKTAVLQTEKLYGIGLTVYGKTGGLAGECGGAPMERGATVEGMWYSLYGRFTKAQLLGGISVTSAEAEPYPLSFSEEDFDKTFLTRTVYLAPKGMKRVMFPPQDPQTPVRFYTDDEGYLLPAERILETDAPAILYLPADYQGRVHVRNGYEGRSGNRDEFSVQVAEGRDPYDPRNVFSDPDFGMFSIEGSFLREQTGIPNQPFSAVWAETDSLLFKADLFFGTNRINTDDGDFLLAKSAKPFRVTRLHFGDPFSDHLAADLPPDGRMTSQNSYLRPVPARKKEDVGMIVREQFTGELFTGEVFCNGRKVSEGGAPFEWDDAYLMGSLTAKMDGRSYPLSFDGGVRLLEKDGDRLQFPFYYQADRKFRVKLTDGGEPVTGAAVSAYRADHPLAFPYSETAPGVYEGEQAFLQYFSVTLEDGKPLCFVNPTDEWKRDGDVYTLEFGIDRPIGFLLDPVDLSQSMENLPIIEFAPNAENTALQIGRAGGSDFLYILARYGDTIGFDLRYGTTGYYRKRVVLSADELLEKILFEKAVPRLFDLGGFPDLEEPDPAVSSP